MKKENYAHVHKIYNTIFSQALLGLISLVQVFQDVILKKDSYLILKGLVDSQMKKYCHMFWDF